MSRVVAWALAAVSVLASAGAAVIAFANDRPEAATSIATVFALCFPVLGALVIRQRGSHSVGWLMIFIGVTVSLHAFLDNWSRAALLWDPGSLPGGVFFSWVALWLWIPGWVFATSLLPVLLPDGRPRGWRRRLAWADGIGVTLIVLVTAVLGWPIRGHIDEPVNPSPELAAAFERLNASYIVWVLVIVVLTLVSLASLVIRYRRETREIRRQIAWVLYGLVLAIVFALIGAWNSVTSLVQVLEALSLVAGIAIAMFRYNLYDIGVVVNRTLVYGGLTAVLGAAYLGSVLLLQLLLSPSSDLAIAGSTLAVAALFRPARGRVQKLVDRRFYRSKYNAQRTLDSFSARLRDEVALDALGAELRGVVADTMQPAHVSLWLRPRK
jgi:hypothetical protein